MTNDELLMRVQHAVAKLVTAPLPTEYAPAQRVLADAWTGLHTSLTTGGELPSAWRSARKPMTQDTMAAARELGRELGSLLNAVEELATMAQKRKHVRGVADA